MSNELTVKKEELVSFAAKNGMEEVLKPLIKEIDLIDTYISGTMFQLNMTLLKNIKESDHLVLRRENNKFDEYAILVLNDAGDVLGYVPEKDDMILSRLMDAGKLLAARVTEINMHHDYQRIKIRIFLVDY